MYNRLAMCMYIHERYKTNITKYLPSSNYLSIAIYSGNIEVYEWLVQFYPSHALPTVDIVHIAIKQNLEEIFNKYYPLLTSNREQTEVEKEELLNSIIQYDRVIFFEKIHLEYLNMDITKIFVYGSFEILKWLHCNRIMIWPIIDYEMISYCICKEHISFLEYYLYTISPESQQLINENTILVVIFNGSLGTLQWLRNKDLLNSITENMISEAIKYFRLSILQWFFEEFKIVLSRQNFEYICTNGNHVMLNYVLKNDFYTEKESYNDIIDFLEYKAHDSVYANDLINYRKVIALLK